MHVALVTARIIAAWLALDVIIAVTVGKVLKKLGDGDDCD